MQAAFLAQIRDRHLLQQAAAQEGNPLLGCVMPSGLLHDAFSPLSERPTLHCRLRQYAPGPVSPPVRVCNGVTNLTALFRRGAE